MGATAGSDGHYFIVNVLRARIRCKRPSSATKPIVLEQVQVAPDCHDRGQLSMEQTVLGVVQTVEIRRRSR